MREFGKYFGGIYMKYWYAAFVVVILFMVFSFINNKHISKYQLTVFDDKGNEVSKKEITVEEMRKGEESFPMAKSFKPIKKF